MPFRRAPDQSSCDDHLLPGLSDRGWFDRADDCAGPSRDPLALCSTCVSSCSTSCGPRPCSRTCSKPPRSPRISRRVCCSPSTTCFKSTRRLIAPPRMQARDRSARATDRRLRLGLSDRSDLYGQSRRRVRRLGPNARRRGEQGARHEPASIHPPEAVVGHTLAPAQGRRRRRSPRAHAPRDFITSASLPRPTARPSTRRPPTRWHGPGTPAVPQADITGRR